MTITLIFDLGEICNDILAKCNIISQATKDAALADIRANIQDVEATVMRGVICRAVTEAFGKVKYAAQRYMTTGRTTDTNGLERLLTIVTDEETETETEVYDTVTLEMAIPNFNPAVTDYLKSTIHEFVVAWVMWRFLQDQLSDKAGEYKVLAEEEHYRKIIETLASRTKYPLRRPTYM